MMRFAINLGWTNGCCGVTQLTEFSQPCETWLRECGETIIGSGDTAEAAYQDLFNKLREFPLNENDHGQVLQIWFQKSKDYRGVHKEVFEAEPLRLLVEQIPNVVNLGEYVNAKTGNKIQGYQWEQLT